MPTCLPLCAPSCLVHRFVDGASSQNSSGVALPSTYRIIADRAARASVTLFNPTIIPMSYYTATVSPQAIWAAAVWPVAQGRDPLQVGRTHGGIKS